MGGTAGAGTTTPRPSTLLTASVADRPDHPARRVLVVLPYVLLGLATLLALLDPGQSARDLLTTVGLVTVTALWALFMNTLRPPPRTRPTWSVVLFMGVQTTLAGLLTAHRGIFLLFALIGFMQAYEVLPPVWGFLCVTATSILVNILPAGVPNNRDWITITVLVVLAQIFLIGWFGFLGQRFTEESEQRRQALAQLEAALAENDGLHAQLLIQAREAGVHDERQRMAHEIHDTLAQGLAGIITQLQAADRTREDPQQWQRHMDHVHALARESLAAARRSVAAVRPTELDDSHLPEAITGLATRWSRESGVPVRVETTGDPRPMLAEIEIAMFRVAQEALTNIAKHARASKVGVTLSYLDDLVMLDVRDDGVGFSMADVAEPGTAPDGTGFGLRAIRQRLERVDGTLTVETAPRDGTAINASIPTTVENES
ncbi:sensor histidine kinase [Micromonospora sp. NPDC004704]